MKWDMRRILAWVIVLLITLAGYLYSKSIPPHSEHLGEEHLVHARVLSVTDSGNNVGPLNSTSQIAMVEITEGEFAGQVLETVTIRAEIWLMILTFTLAIKSFWTWCWKVKKL